MIDMHKRMGDVVQQDIVLTLDVVHKLIKGLEQDFLSKQGQAAKKNISDVTVCILAPLLGGLISEKTLKLVLGET